MIFIGLSLLVINLYEDEIKQFAVKKINEQLTTKVEVKSIDLTLIDQFPMASLRFKNVFIADQLSTSKKDTMITIDYLYLNLNFMDLINGKYAIKDVKATNTIAYLKINEAGKDNYSIVKEDTSTTDKQFSFDLEKVRFNGLKIAYSNAIQRQLFDINTEDLKLTGRFSDINYRLKTKGDLFVNNFMNDSVNYVFKKNAALDLDLLIDTQKQAYTIKKGKLRLEDLNFSITGRYSSEVDKNPEIDLNIKGDNIKFISIFSVFPPAFLTSLKKYDSKGLLNFVATIKGEIAKEKTPIIKANFNLEQGELTEKETGVSLNNLSFSGTFYNKNKTENELLRLNNIKGQLTNDGGDFSGYLTLKDFANMQVKTSIQSNLDLSIVNQFIASPVIKTLDGKAAINYNLTGKYINDQFKISNSKGAINFENVNISTTENNLIYTNLSGLGVLNQNDIAFQNFEGTVANSTFNGNTKIRNLIPYFLDHSNKVWIDASVSSKKLDLTALIHQMKTDEVADNKIKEDTVRLPHQFQVNIAAKFNELNYEKFTAKNISGQIALKNQHLYTKNLTFKTSGGNVLFNSELEQTATNEFLWTGNSKLDGIDIQAFFTSVDNFSQDFLTDQNIKGKGSLLFDFGMLFTPSFDLNYPSITVNAQTKITNGMLTNHSTMIELANYLDGNKLVNKIVDTKRLKKKIDKIKFSELSNRIKIKNSLITIPKTTIKSNILDITLSGEHSFDNNIDYHFNFGLRDILIKNKNVEDFGPIEDDGLGKVIFLHVFGPLTDLNYKIDKTEKKASRKENRTEEKQNVKSILKEEFGLFKKDSTLKKTKEKLKEPTFEIENWEENDQPKTTEEEQNNKEKKKKKTPKWLKNLGVDTEKKKEVPKQELLEEFDEEDL